MAIPQQRAEDKGWARSIAQTVSHVWDWVDKRQIDVTAVSVTILYGSFKILLWSLEYATHANRPGLEVAAIIAAVAGPWSLMQGAALKFIFEARTKSFEVGKPNAASSSFESTTVRKETS